MGHLIDDLSDEQRTRLAHSQHAVCHGSTRLDTDICALQIRSVRQYNEKSLHWLSKFTVETRSTLQRYETGGYNMSLRTAITVLDRLGYDTLIVRRREGTT